MVKGDATSFCFCTAGMSKVYKSVLGNSFIGYLREISL